MPSAAGVAGAGWTGGSKRFHGEELTAYNTRRLHPSATYPIGVYLGVVELNMDGISVAAIASSGELGPEKIGGANRRSRLCRSSRGNLSMDTGTVPHTRIIELDIQGMTCASRVARVDRKPGKPDGVPASVNLPLESAQVTVPRTVTDQQILDTITATGYTARRRAAPAGGGGVESVEEVTGEAAHEPAHETPAASASLRARLFAHNRTDCAGCRHFHGHGRPVPAVGMAGPGTQPARGQLGGLAFHRAAAINARHLASTMDTLVSIGVGAQLSCSPAGCLPIRR